MDRFFIQKDSNLKVKNSHDNTLKQKIYRDFLEKLLSKKSLELLQRKYNDKSYLNK